MSAQPLNPNDKKQFGVLREFESLIVFAYDNGKGKSGAFCDADIHKMRNIVVQVFKQRPDLKEFFRSCAMEATGLIVL